MTLHIDERSDGNIAVYLEGDLQFDTVDEALYHESLALPALCLAAQSQFQSQFQSQSQRHTAHRQDGLRVLICGGGDGLALREVLRFPGVVHADLVDYDPEMVRLGQTRLAEWNRHAFQDPRVSVHLVDAWDFLSTADTYDVILCDFTVPRRPEDTRVFSRDWFERLRERLRPGGILAVNAVSPQVTPEAFASLRQTVSAAGLFALPFRVCIPSFRALGYGAWAFILAANHPLSPEDLRTLSCPVTTRQADLNQLWRAADFPVTAVSAPVHSLAQPCLLPLLLNPGAPASDGIFRALSVLHPSHTRAMVETLAEQVAGSVRGVDLQRLVEALLRRAAELPRELQAELRRLRDVLQAHLAPWESLGAWASRLLAVLILILTLANAIAPDNAFAKGAEGIGHAGVSRGLGGGDGSFGRSGSFNSGSSSGGYEAPSSFHVTGSGYRTRYGQNEATDISGYPYPTRTFRIYGSQSSGGGGYGGGGYQGGNYSSSPNPVPEVHTAVFVADDDLLVLDSGDVVVTLSDTTYLLASGGTLSLWSSSSPHPLLFLNPDPKLFAAIATELQGRQASARQEIALRRDWLSWVGWTTPLFAAVREDETELRNLQDLDTRLTTAAAHVGVPAAGALGGGATVVTPDQVELFVGCVLMPDCRVGLREGDGQWVYTDGRSLTSDAEKSHPAPLDPALAKALRSVMQKLQKEFTADIAKDNSDLSSGNTALASLKNDLDQYQSLYAQNGYDGSYEVDYGTDSIGVSDAINRTQNDLQSSRNDQDLTQAHRDILTLNAARLTEALEKFKG